MNAVWLDEGAAADYPRLKKHGITHIFRSERDPRTTTAALERDRAEGFKCGIYAGHGWYAHLTGPELAVHMTSQWVNLGGLSRSLAVQFNEEGHDPVRVIAMLKQWRALRPNAATSWTMEGFQGGWIKEIAAELKALRVKLVPQAYDGAMNPFDSFGCVRDLTENGIPYDRVEVFYDAARLLRGWRGFAFTQNRLPA